MSSAANTIKGLQETLTIWQKGAHKDFELAMNKPPSSRAEALFNRLAPTFPSNYVTEKFPGILGISELKEFNGEIDYSGLDNYDNAIASLEYALGLKIKWRDLRADMKNLALLQNLPSLLSIKARRRKFKNLVNLLQANGTWTVDGLSIFNDNHFFGDNNLSVNVSSTTNPTKDDWRLIFNAIWNARAIYTDDHGNSLDEDSDITQLIVMGHASYMTSAREMARNTLIPEDTPNGTGGAATNNINAGTFDFWGSPRFTVPSTSPVLYVAFMEETDQAGNPMGKSVPFLRTEFTPYELVVAGASPEDPEFRNHRRIEMNVYGEEGLGVIDATRIMKVTLT